MACRCRRRYRDEILLLALRLASVEPSRREWDYALRAAEARLDLVRARRARDELISRTQAQYERRSTACALEITEEIDRICALERYERSAAARLRRTVRVVRVGGRVTDQCQGLAR